MTKNLKYHQSITTGIPKCIWVVDCSSSGRVQVPSQAVKKNQLLTFELRDVWLGTRALIPKLEMMAAHH